MGRPKEPAEGGRSLNKWGKRATEKSLPMENIHQEGFIAARSRQLQNFIRVSFLCFDLCFLLYPVYFLWQDSGLSGPFCSLPFL